MSPRDKKVSASQNAQRAARAWSPDSSWSTVLAVEEAQKLGFAAAQARGCRQPFEIVRLEGRCLIRTLQRVVRLTPRATSVAFTAVFKNIHLNHARAEPYAGPSS